MAKICELCGKSTASGNRIRHKHSGGWMYKAPKTKRTFKPNLRKIDVDIEGTPSKIRACMKCYKKLKAEQE